MVPSNTPSTPNIPSPEKNSVWDRLKGLMNEPQPAIDFQSQKQAISGYKAATDALRPRPSAPSTVGAPPAPVPPTAPQATAGPLPSVPVPAEASSAFKRFVSPREQWHAPKVLKTNLIHDELTTFVNWGRQGAIAAAVVLSAAAIVGAVYGGLSYWQKQVTDRGDALVTEIAALKKTINVAEQGLDDIKRYESQVALASGLLDRHVYYSNVLRFLEQYLLPDVYITGGLNGDISGTFVFTLQGPSYAAIAEQVAVLKALPMISEARVDSGGLAKAQTSGKTGVPGQRSVGFTLNLVIDPAIFRYDAN